MWKTSNLIKNKYRNLCQNLFRSLCNNPYYQRLITKQFHLIFYGFPGSFQAWQNVSWLGIPTWKCPMDLWVLGEIISAHKPDIVIECGTWRGGSALFFASICEMLGKGRVITIDIEKRGNRPSHPCLQYILGSSIEDVTLTKLANAIQEKDDVMVILDSNHEKEHVLKELLFYSSLVTSGQYLVIEDSNINGNPVLEEFGPGPMEAVSEFLKNNSEFEIDKNQENFFLTFNPNGYLKRK